MSDTPRTDAAWEVWHKEDWDLAWNVSCLAQQLERELTRAIEQRDRAMVLAHTMRSTRQGSLYFKNANALLSRIEEEIAKEKEAK